MARFNKVNFVISFQNILLMFSVAFKGIEYECQLWGLYNILYCVPDAGYEIDTYFKV